MKVSMTRMEHLATDHAKRFAKAWDYFCIATAAYMSGYTDAKEHGNLPTLGTEVVEKEINDGLHQLSVHSFTQWQKENDALCLKDALEKFVTTFNFEEIRVSEDKSGLISFQGTCRKK